MASQHVQTFTDANFQQEVLDAKMPVLVDFWAEWCRPCQWLAPTIDEVAGMFAGKVKVGKVDTDENKEVAVKYGISAIPTVILFKNGQSVKKFIGMTSRDQLADAMNEALAG